MDKLAQELPNSPSLPMQMAHAMDRLKSMDEVLRIRLMRRLRMELSELLSTLPLHSERRSYLIHQIPHCHQLEELNDIVQEINRPASDGEAPKQRIFLTLSNYGASWCLEDIRATH